MVNSSFQKLQERSQYFFLGYSGTVTRNTLIATIANWGPEYRVEVDIMVHSAGLGYSSILHFTSTGSDCCNVENRVPAIYYHSDGRLLIASAVNETGNQHIWFKNIDLEKWYHIKIVQAIENGKVREDTYEHNYYIVTKFLFLLLNSSSTTTSISMEMR